MHQYKQNRFIGVFEAISMTQETILNIDSIIIDGVAFVPMPINEVNILGH